jgi:hypothetical protein
MLNIVENLLENERDPGSGPMNDQDHSLSLSFLQNFLWSLVSCHTSVSEKSVINSKYLISAPSYFSWQCQLNDKSPIQIYTVPAIEELWKF